MITVSVMYPHREGCTFDMDYYCKIHMGLVRELLGGDLKALQAEQGIRGSEPGSPEHYAAIGRLTFDSLDIFRAAFRIHGKALMDDIVNFTNIEPIVQVGEILLSV